MLAIQFYRFFPGFVYFGPSCHFHLLTRQLSQVILTTGALMPTDSEKMISFLILSPMGAPSKGTFWAHLQLSQWRTTSVVICL